MLDTKTEK